MSEVSENTTEIDIIALAKARKKALLEERHSESWGSKQLRRFKWRTAVQFSMIILCIILAFQFVRFVASAFAGGNIPLASRPSGVDGFLPITGLMGLVDWLAYGELNKIHPAATILFLVFLLISVLWRKAFCSWLCPVGTISEYLAMLGRKIFGRNFKLWKWLDISLRSLKYILLSFFVGSILFMGIEGTHDFINSDYNFVADVKMGMFFIRMGVVGISVMSFLLIGSIFVNGLWCRYLCPYGALLGLFSWLSPTSVVRSVQDCIDCGLCDKACPARLPVMSKKSIVSVECTGCFDCVASCPVPAALNIESINFTDRAASTGKSTASSIRGLKQVSIKSVGIAVVTVFVGVWILAQVFGLWNNHISDDEYRARIPMMDQFGHPGR